MFVAMDVGAVLEDETDDEDEFEDNDGLEQEGWRYMYSDGEAGLDVATPSTRHDSTFLPHKRMYVHSSPPHVVGKGRFTFSAACVFLTQH